MDEVLNPSQVAELLRIHIKTVHRLAIKGQFSGNRIGRSWRFRRSAILEMLSSWSDVSRRNGRPAETTPDKQTEHQ